MAVRTEVELLATFNVDMAQRLAKNSWKRGWWTLTRFQLLKRLRDEVKELHSALLNEDHIPASAIRNEAADVANFAAMIADMYRKDGGE